MSAVYIVLLLTLCCMLVAPSTTTAEELATYPVPDGIATRDQFTVKVRQPNGAWQTLSCYEVEVDMHHRRKSSMVYFDFEGEVEIAVTYNGGDVRSMRVRPLSYGIEPTIDGNTLTVILAEPRNLSIEVNGDIFDNLHLFAGPIETDAPDPNDPSVMYFGPGVHEPGDKIDVPSNTTVYLAGGAVVKSMLSCSKAENVRVVGRGMIYRPQRGIEINFSKNVLIDGITVVNPRYYTVSGGQSRNVTVRNLKSFSSQGWSDGIDMMSCSDVQIDSVFMRNSDDCIAIYAHRWDFYGDARDITVRNSTLWADVAHPINIGTHGNPENPEVIENLAFVNLDILNHDESQLDYQGCISINASDENLIRDVRVEDMRIEDFERGQLLNLRVTFNRKYATAPGRGIENVLFKDVTYTGKNANLSIVSGYNEDRSIKNIVFENLTINGRLIWDGMEGKPGYFKTSDMAGFYVGEHVSDVEFRATKPPS